MKVSKRCSICSSTAIVKLAECTWDEKLQEWIPISLASTCICLDCESTDEEEFSLVLTDNKI